jgi:hypothetical protein
MGTVFRFRLCQLSPRLRALAATLLFRYGVGVHKVILVEIPRRPTAS